MEKQVVKNFVIYSLPDFLAKFALFLTLPITTAYLTLEDFGYLGLFTICSIPFTVLAEFGPGYIINSTWFKFDKDQRAELLFNLLVISGLLYLLAIIIISIFCDKIFPLLVGDNWVVIRGLYWVLILKVLFNIPSSIFISWLIIEQKAKLSSIVQAIEIVLTVAAVLLIVILTQNYRYIILGTVAVFVFTSIIKISLLYPVIKVKLRRKYFRLAYQIGCPIFFRCVFNQIRKQIDVFYVAKLFGVGPLASYNFSKKCNNLFTSMSINYNKSYEPIVYKQLSEGELHIINLRRILFFWFYVTLLFSSLIFIFGRPLITLFTHGVFTHAYPLVLLFLCVLLVEAPFYGVLQIMVYYQKTKFIFFATAIQGVLSIFLCAILIPLYGAKGGIIAMWAGTFVYFAMNFLVKRKLLREHFIEKITWFYVLIFHILVILQVLFNIKIHSILVFLLLAILTIHGCIREKEFLKNVITKILRGFASLYGYEKV